MFFSNPKNLPLEKKYKISTSPQSAYGFFNEKKYKNLSADIMSALKKPNKAMFFKSFL